MRRSLVLVGGFLLLVWIIGLRADAYEWNDTNDAGPSADHIPWNTMVRDARIISEDPSIIQPACGHGYCSTAIRVDAARSGTGAYWRPIWHASAASPVQLVVDGDHVVLDVSDATYQERPVVVDVLGLATALIVIRWGLGGDAVVAGVVAMAITAAFWIGYAALWFFVIGAVGVALVVAGLGYCLQKVGRTTRIRSVGQAILETGGLLIPIAWALGPYLAAAPTR